jgi:glycosyltransferase involved in cell wall biosynthesis
MKCELLEDFGQDGGRVTVIPFGINNAVPNTALTPDAAKQRLGLRKGQKVLLFFGRITPYKGLEYLIDAFRQIVASDDNYRLLIAGRPDNCEKYWSALREEIREDVQNGRVVLNADFIPDEDTEVYFKAADAVILPYRQIYQSGVLFLGHSFGLPVLAADVGSLKDDIVEGENGYTFRAEDPADLARVIKEYFAGDLYADLNGRRRKIQNYANERHSWETVAEIITSVYASLLRIPSPGNCRASRSA